MPRRSKRYIKIPWTGGLNTKQDPGVTSDNDLVTADNIQFTSSGARKKRDGLEYLDSDMPSITHRASYGRLKVLTLDANLNDGSDYLLVEDEEVTITTSVLTGDELDYAESDATTYLNREISKITCVADVAASLDGTYFLAYDDSDSVEIWIDVDDSGTAAPGVGARAIEVTGVSTGDTAADVATAVATAVNADSKFTCIANGADLILISSTTGTKTDTADVDTGFAVSKIQDGASAGTATDSLAYLATDALDEAATATSTLTLSRAASYIAVKDYWFYNTGTNLRSHAIYTVSSQGKVFKHDPSSYDRVEVAATGGANVASDPTKAYMKVLNEKLIISFQGIGNTPVVVTGATSLVVFDDLSSDAPDFEFMEIWLNRLWVNDKENPDRSHYSATGNPAIWGGAEDSGAIDIRQGDGDPEGITAIFPPFRDALHIAKLESLYRIEGTTPENFRVNTVSTGIGCVSHRSATAVDQNDIVFVSKRGVHSLVTTDQYGDFSGQYLSDKIQPTFANEWSKARLEFTQAQYNQTLNSFAIAVSEETNATENSFMYLFSLDNKEWYRWPNVSCESLAVRDISTETKFLMGTNNSRLIQSQRGLAYDFDQEAIQYRIKTPAIYPGGDLHISKLFQRITMIYKPLGNFSFTLQAKIDNQAVQSFSFNQSAGLDLLGSTFILGQSILGATSVLQPFSYTMDGLGRGITLEITQSGSNETVEIYGFIIEFEDADLTDEISE